MHGLTSPGQASGCLISTLRPLPPSVPCRGLHAVAGRVRVDTRALWHLGEGHGRGWGSGPRGRGDAWLDIPRPPGLEHHALPSSRGGCGGTGSCQASVGTPRIAQGQDPEGTLPSGSIPGGPLFLLPTFLSLAGAWNFWLARGILWA